MQQSAIVHQGQSLCLSVHTRYEHENDSVWLDHTLPVLRSYSNASALAPFLSLVLDKIATTYVV